MQMPFLSSRESYEDATDLIERFGDDAGYEAAALADRSRDIGNHVRFCHWRQIERMIVLLSIQEAIGTVH